MKNILLINPDNSWTKIIREDLGAEGFNCLDSFLSEDGIDLIISGIDDIPENLSLINVPVINIRLTNFHNPQTAESTSNKEIMYYPYEKSDLISKVNALIKRNDIFKSYGTRTNVEKNLIKETNNILLIDDDPKLSRLFEYNLTHAGFKVKTAVNGHDALNVLENYVPDIIVCDIMMPVMDGFEFRREVLKNNRVKGIPFVFLTAKGEETDILEGYDLEIEDYIIKTAGPRILVAKVSAILKSLDKERKKLVSEIHEAADSLRAKVVPDTNPALDGFDIQHWHQPYKGIPGGDFIDYFVLDEDNLAIIMGDVMGKKWGAWYFAFAYAGYVRSAIRVVLQSSAKLSASAILQKVNESIYQDAKVSEVFATLSILVLNKKNKTAQYSGAGDFPVIYKNSRINEVIELHSKGLLLGFAFNGDYSDVNVDLSAGDILFLTTDGLIESRNSSGESFGSNRLKQILHQLPETGDHFGIIKEEILTFSSGDFEDDLSIICIKCI